VCAPARLSGGSEAAHAGRSVGHDCLSYRFLATRCLDFVKDKATRTGAGAYAAHSSAALKRLVPQPAPA